MNLTELGLWFSAIGAIGVPFAAYTFFKGRKIEHIGSVALPIISKSPEKIPCEFEIVNYGSRQFFISRLCIELKAWDDWESNIDLAIHGLVPFKLEDGEIFKKTLCLHKEILRLEQWYRESAGTLDKYMPLRVNIYLITAKEQKLKLKVSRALKEKLINRINKRSIQ
ncbi:hypothetical protein [Pseudoalteromonas piscicida]|uniref:hypothetical protein n=1 Tax=Pseudoalteromonas piscicida TaxID=43662 RepID=UPI0032C09BEB